MLKFGRIAIEFTQQQQQKNQSYYRVCLQKKPNLTKRNHSELKVLQRFIIDQSLYVRSRTFQHCFGYKQAMNFYLLISNCIFVKIIFLGIKRTPLTISSPKSIDDLIRIIFCIYFVFTCVCVLCLSSSLFVLKLILFLNLV